MRSNQIRKKSIHQRTLKRRQQKVTMKKLPHYRQSAAGLPKSTLRRKAKVEPKRATAEAAEAARLEAEKKLAEAAKKLAEEAKKQRESIKKIKNHVLINKIPETYKTFLKTYLSINQNQLKQNTKQALIIEGHLKFFLKHLSDIENLNILDSNNLKEVVVSLLSKIDDNKFNKFIEKLYQDNKLKIFIEKLDINVDDINVDNNIFGFGDEGYDEFLDVSGIKNKKKDIKKNQYYKSLKELTDTEQTYLKDITLLKNSLSTNTNVNNKTQNLKEILYNSGIDVEDFTDKIQKLLNYHNQFYKDGKFNIEEYIKYMKDNLNDFVDVYSSIQIYQSKLENTKLTTLILNDDDPLSTLPNLLHKTIQRIMKYPNLFKEIKKRTDILKEKEALNEALDKALDLSNEINETIQTQTFNKKAEEIYKYLEKKNPLF